MKTPTYNFPGMKMGMYCMQHAEETMVNVRSKRCLHDSCTRRPSFNVNGSKLPMYCKQHAEEGMVHVRNKRCSHASCMTQPNFNVKGSKVGVYCKRHAKRGMVDVLSPRCAHETCTMTPNWGVPTNSSPTVCRLHMSDIKSDLVINFRAHCKVVGCRKASRWGLEGKKPTHCPVHGPLEDGLVCTVMGPRARVESSKPSYRARASRAV